MKIRIKEMSMDKNLKKSLKKNGFDVKKAFRSKVYEITLPTNVYLEQEDMRFYKILRKDGRNFGRVSYPNDESGGILTFIPEI